MSEIIVNISPEKEGLVKEFVENLGGTVIVQKKEKGKTKKKVSVKKGAVKTISPTFLFGMWEDFDIDPRKLRQEVWERKF